MPTNKEEQLDEDILQFKDFIEAERIAKHQTKTLSAIKDNDFFKTVYNQINNFETEFEKKL